MLANTPFTSLFLHFTGCPLVSKSSLLGVLRSYREGKTLQAIEEHLKKENDKKRKAVCYLQKAFMEVQCALGKEAKVSMEMALEMDESVGKLYVFSFLGACCAALACNFPHAAKLLIKTKELLDDPALAQLTTEVETKINETFEQSKLVYEKVFSFFSKSVSTTRLITQDELDFNIAVALYNACQYFECINLVDLMLQKSKQSETAVIAYCHFMKGSSYLFMNNPSEESCKELELSYQLEKREETLRNLNMSRDLMQGKTNKMHYKLIHEDILYQIFSYLPIYSVMTLSSTCRLWRHLAGQSLSKREYLDIYYENFINNIDSHLDNFNSKKDKYTKPLQPYHIFDNVIKSSLFDSYCENAVEKKIIITENAFQLDPEPKVWFDDVHHEYIGYEKRFFRNVKLLYVPLYTWFKDEVEINKSLERNCANVEELVLFSPHLERELERNAWKVQSVLDVIRRIPPSVKKVTLDFVLVEQDFPQDYIGNMHLKFKRLDYVDVNENEKIIEKLFKPHFPNVEVKQIQFQEKAHYKRDYPYRIAFYQEPPSLINLR